MKSHDWREMNGYKTHLQQLRAFIQGVVMVIRGVAMIGFILALPLALPAAQSTAPPAGWKEFTSNDQSFTVWLPDKGGRNSTRDRTTTSRGVQLKLSLVEFEAKGGPVFNVTGVVLPAQYAAKNSLKQRLELLRDAFVDDVKGKVDGEKEVEQSGLKGKEYAIQAAEKQARVRVFAKGARVFRIAVTGTKDQVEAADANTFLESFKLAAKPADAGAAKAADPAKGPDAKPPAGGIAPEWTSDLAKMAFPEGAAAGKVSGKDFKLESAKLEGNVLTLRQGKGFFPDLAVLIFLFPKAGETVFGKTYEISKSDAANLRPHIHVERMDPGQKLPMTKVYINEYVMKLELGMPKNGVATGKIYMCVADPGRTVVAGTFEVKAK
jgi:hypothetical protein